MLGYDWPRLHAALNDLPTALLLTAHALRLGRTLRPATVSPAGGILLWARSGRWQP